MAALPDVHKIPKLLAWYDKRLSVNKSSRVKAIEKSGLGKEETFQTRETTIGDQRSQLLPVNGDRILRYEIDERFPKNVLRLFTVEGDRLHQLQYGETRRRRGGNAGAMLQRGNPPFPKAVRFVEIVETIGRVSDLGRRRGRRKEEINPTRLVVCRY
ncbi:unnamed protein product [Nesidiocoris tenuis]|uniref:Uncharacterized protein n=1 Tax=Nesidiocoris tenuis TaxID=355587 RepID=A0A6H5HHQ6_9HEMI|nr:unnamed protein product [Nesidiocoris tenuis]CAB0017575.1 unnamed protein product [Nesidiocoris tenuis]